MVDESVIVVREFDRNKDLFGVEDVERRCEVGPSGKLSLFTDLLGDPICRVRHSPAFLMLVYPIFGFVYLFLDSLLKNKTKKKTRQNPL